LFGELDWRFAPDWTLLTGLRHDHERNNTDITQDDFSSPAQVDKTFNATLPKIGLSHLLAADQQLGATWQKGYRSGGVNIRAGAGHVAYDPEYTSNLEFSYRGAFLDKRWRTSANVYVTDWKNQQVSVSNPATGGVTEVQNAARSRMKGLEATTDFDLSRAWMLSAGMSYNDARYRDFVTDEGNDASGQAFLAAPKTMVILGARYRFDGLTVNADVAYREGSPSEYLFDATTKQVIGVRRSDSCTVVNLTAEYRLAKGVTLGAYVKNLFDERYVTNNRSGATVDVGAPRRLGAVLRYDL
jgi:outer membrane receptor protein involved in Fe transport